MSPNPTSELTAARLQEIRERMQFVARYQRVMDVDPAIQETTDYASLSRNGPIWLTIHLSRDVADLLVALTAQAQELEAEKARRGTTAEAYLDTCHKLDAALVREDALETTLASLREQLTQKEAERAEQHMRACDATGMEIHWRKKFEEAREQLTHAQQEIKAADDEARKDLAEIDALRAERDGLLQQLDRSPQPLREALQALMAKWRYQLGKIYRKL